MHFEDADQQIIRSTTQRGLMLHWERSKKERPLLPLTEFDLDGRCHDAGQLSFCAVEGINDGVSFRVLREGSQVMAAYDSDWTGQYLHDVLPRHVKDTVLAAFDRCREKRSAIYTVSSITDESGIVVDCERLLLPFGVGDTITHVVASLQLISIEGAFVRQNILGNVSRVVATSIAAIIILPRVMLEPNTRQANQGNSPATGEPVRGALSGRSGGEDSALV